MIGLDPNETTSAAVGIVETSEIHDMSEYVEEALQYIALSQQSVKDQIASMFKLGILCLNMLENKKLGDSAVKKLALEITQKQNGKIFYQQRLYEAARVAKTFEKDEERLFKDMVKMSLNMDVTWNFLVKQCRPQIIDNSNKITDGELNNWHENHKREIENAGRHMDKTSEVTEKLLVNKDTPAEFKKDLKNTADSADVVVPDMKSMRAKNLLAKAAGSIQLLNSINFEELPPKEKGKCFTTVSDMIASLKKIKKRLEIDGDDSTVGNTPEETE